MLNATEGFSPFVSFSWLRDCSISQRRSSKVISLVVGSVYTVLPVQYRLYSSGAVLADNDEAELIKGHRPGFSITFLVGQSSPVQCSEGKSDLLVEWRCSITSNSKHGKTGNDSFEQNESLEIFSVYFIILNVNIQLTPSHHTTITAVLLRN